VTDFIAFIFLILTLVLSSFNLTNFFFYLQTVIVILIHFILLLLGSSVG